MAESVSDNESVHKMIEYFTAIIVNIQGKNCLKIIDY